MKNIGFILSFLLLSIAFPKQVFAEEPDTLLTVESPSRVIITESPEGMRLTVTDTDSLVKESFLVDYAPGAKVTTSRSSSVSIFKIPGFDYPGKPEKSCEDRSENLWVASIDGVCIGLNNAMGQTGGGGLQWSKSFEISWLSCLNVGYRFSRSRIYLGLGFDWRNYRATADGRWMVADGNGGVAWGQAPEDAAAVRSSRLKVFSLQMPLMYTWVIPKTKLKWRVGPILNFNTYASLLGVYDDKAGNRCEYFTKDIDRNRVTVDFLGSLSYNSMFGIYVRYSPMKVLKESSPINFTPFTIGVGFFI
ncbi:MAG: hypothetical protein K2K93_07680 [Muribaculaceae bacterium]|nr:hypothetical protein [Muribaculaceae bacterium]